MQRRLAFKKKNCLLLTIALDFERLQCHYNGIEQIGIFVLGEKTKWSP